MDGSLFDILVSRLTEPGSRRRALGVLGISAMLAGGLPASSIDTEAGRGRHKKRKKSHKGNKGNKGNNGGDGATPLALRDICTPGKSTCETRLKCDSPTTRHSCSSTVDGVDAWCCVQPGDPCTECDCCGDYYCSGDGSCIPNPEG
jgi:hypothetical protein